MYTIFVRESGQLVFHISNPRLPYPRINAWSITESFRDPTRELIRGCTILNDPVPSISTFDTYTRVQCTLQFLHVTLINFALIDVSM